MHLLGNRAGILAPDVLRGELHVAQSGANLRVTHQVHQGGQGNAGANHIGSKGVAEAVRVSLGDVAGEAVLTKERA